MLTGRSFATAIAILAVLGGVASTWFRCPTSNNKEFNFYTPTVNSLEGKTIVITGGTAGLGLESAKRLAVGGATVILTSRTDAKGRSAVEDAKEYVTRRTGIDNPDVTYLVLDLDDIESVRAAANNLIEKGVKIDVLMNNAGVLGIPELRLTKDGVEQHMQSNHLGHFAFTALLKDILQPNARIINVSSIALYRSILPWGLDFDYIWKPEERSYRAFYSYSQSKLANLLFTQELQRRSEQHGYQWIVTSVHPGAVATDMPRHIVGHEKMEQFKMNALGFMDQLLVDLALLVVKTVEDGASTQIWLAVANGTEKMKASFYADCCRISWLPGFAKSETDAKRLWEESEKLSGIEFDLSVKPIHRSVVDEAIEKS